MDFKKLYTWLQKPVSNTSIVLFRIVFSLCLLIQTYYFLSEGFVEENIIKPFTLFPFIDSIQPIENITVFNFLINPMMILAYIMLFSNIGMLFNKISRISTLIFFLCFTYFWLLDKGYFNNHYYFISIICFLIVIINPNSSFKKNIYVPRISLICLQAMIFIIYFIAGINKLNPYWLIDMQPMSHILETQANETGNTFFINPIVLGFVTYGGVFYDLTIGFLLLWKPTRALGFILVFVFNIINYLLFKEIGEIGVFPLIMISTLILFIRPESLDNLFKLNTKPKIKTTQHRWINIFIISFLFIQIIIPFRHLLIKGHVDYNTMGQRFSWRMKTMYKKPYTAGVIGFDIYLKTNGYKEKIAHVNLYNLEDFSDEYATSSMYLTQKQKTALLYYPDMLPIFCNQLEEVLKDYLSKQIKVDFDIIINAQCEMGFMGRAPQAVIDPSVDLTRVSSSNTNTWMYKLQQSPWDLK